MKYCLVFALTLVLAGCSKKKGGQEEVITPAEPELKKEEVMTNLSRNPYHISEWYAVSGKDTMFLNADPVYEAVMKNIYLIFVDDQWVEYYAGEGFPNTVFLGKAETFNVNLLFFRPLGLVYRWDENEGTMIVSGRGKPDGLPALFPEDVTMKLDKKGYSRLKTFEEAKARRVTGTMRFHYQQDGKDYTFVLKQMWPYADGSSPKHTLYVVF